MTSSIAAVRTAGLSKQYHGAEDFAVRDLDLVVRPGIVYCLLGRNGAGKTTTIRMLTTLLPHSSGSAEVLGTSITDVRRLRPLIGVALQEVALDPWLSAKEQLTLGLAMAGWPRATRQARLSELVERFGLGSFQRRRIGSLSGGMRRRVDVALAVAHDPELLFLDEPSSGLDVEGKAEVWKVIEELRAQGRTVMLTTHDMEEAVALSDEVGIIDRGALIASGPAEQLTRRHGVQAHVAVARPPDDALFTGLREAGFTVESPEPDTTKFTVTFDAATAQRLAALSRVLTEHGFEDAQLEVRSTSLRDAFLEATR